MRLQTLSRRRSSATLSPAMRSHRLVVFLFAADRGDDRCSASTIPRGRQNITWQGFTLDNYLDIWSRPQITGPMLTSLAIAALSTVVATAFGTMIALALTRYRFRSRGALNLLIFLPMTAPEIILGASLLTLWISFGTARGFLTILSPTSCSTSATWS